MASASQEEEAQIATRIEFLAAGVQTYAPVTEALAAHLGSQLRSFVVENQIEPSEATKLRFCTGCSALLMPGMNCRIRTERASRTKRRRKKVLNELVIRCKRCETVHRQAGAPGNQLRTLLSQAEARRQLQRATMEEEAASPLASGGPSEPRASASPLVAGGPSQPRASASPHPAPAASPSLAAVSRASGGVPPSPPPQAAGATSPSPTASRQADRKKAARAAKRTSLQAALAQAGPASPAPTPLSLLDFLHSLSPASPAVKKK